MNAPALLFLLIFTGVCQAQTNVTFTVRVENSTEVAQQSVRWNHRAISYLSAIIAASLVIVSGAILTTIRGVREHRRLAFLNETITSDRDISLQGTSIITGPAEWSEQDLAYIAKNWNSFSFDERIRFCQVFFLKMDQETAPLFLLLFLEAFAFEMDRRVWYHLIDCFHLLFSMVYYNTELTNKLRDAVTVEAERILLNIGKEEMKGEGKDSSFLRFACYDAMILLQNTKVIKRVLASFESKQFEYVTSLRLAVWTCVAREDKDPSDMRFHLKERLQSEKKEEERKEDHEESGTRRQHLIFAIGATTDSGIYEYMYNKFVTEYAFSASELVYLFKGACAFPDTRKRIMEAFWNDKKLQSKISKDKEAHEQIISILARTALEEKEIHQLEDHIVSSRDIGGGDNVDLVQSKKKFCFEELLSRAGRYNSNSSVLHSNLIKFLDERMEKDSHTAIPM